VCGVIAPHQDTIYDYTVTHLQTASVSGKGAESERAQYCIKALTDAHLRRNRFVASVRSCFLCLFVCLFAFLLSLSLVP
jgi:hypothetical protein